MSVDEIWKLVGSLFMHELIGLIVRDSCKYVDLLSLTIQSDITVPVFSPDHHFITYDGLHLTLSGTQYYVQLLSGLGFPW